VAPRRAPELDVPPTRQKCSDRHPQRSSDRLDLCWKIAYARVESIGAELAMNRGEFIATLGAAVATLGAA
jgi:hypothetical protein